MRIAGSRDPVADSLDLKEIKRLPDRFRPTCLPGVRDKLEARLPGTPEGCREIGRAGCPISFPPSPSATIPESVPGARSSSPLRMHAATGPMAASRTPSTIHRNSTP